MRSQTDSEYSERGKATYRGKGSAKWCSPQRKHVPDRSGRRYDANLPAGNNEATTQVVECEVNHFEEPGAVIPHAGIRGGAVG